MNTHQQMSASRTTSVETGDESQTTYRSVEVDGLQIFYREAGSRDAPHVLLLHGFPTSSRISPDNWRIDQALLDRPGNSEIQLQLFQSYSSNLPLYAQWQDYFRRHQPPALIVWGKHDQVFAVEGAHQYKRDLEQAEVHLLDTGHFALEEEGDTIAGLMRRFLDRWLGTVSSRAL